jgi:hypothetical protein
MSALFKRQPDTLDHKVMDPALLIESNLLQRLMRDHPDAYCDKSFEGDKPLARTVCFIKHLSPVFTAAVTCH